MSGRTKGGATRLGLGRTRIKTYAIASTCTVAFFPTPAFAHASERGHVLLLPTGYYLVGGAFAVAASFLALLVLPSDPLRRLATSRLPLVFIPASLRLWTSWSSFLLLCGLLVAGVFGSRDPLSNPLPLVIWTMLWIGLTLIQGVVGNLWAWIDPWHGPVALARRLFSLRSRPYPAWLGYWPALALFAGFVWFELIDAAPDDPFRLAVAVASYWVATALLMLVFGHEAWSRHGEFLSVFFRMVSRFGFLDARRSPDGKRVDIAFCLPGAKLWTQAPLPLSGTLFLLAALASVSFDGFAKTFLWLGSNGINPLEFPGRTALRSINTAGLTMMFAALTAFFLGAIALGERLAGGRSWRDAAGLLVWSIVPIALAYHFSHYLTALLVNAQYAVVALSDPLALGWNLLGTGDWHVEPGVVMGHDAAHAIWNLQAAAIIGGHVVAVVVAHALARNLHGQGRRPILAETPLTVLMIGYTIFGLWLLSTPTAG